MVVTGRITHLRVGSNWESLPTYVGNVFCPTGEGGGVDPSCTSGSGATGIHAGGGSAAASKIEDTRWLGKKAYKVGDKVFTQRAKAEKHLKTLGGGKAATTSRASSTGRTLDDLMKLEADFRRGDYTAHDLLAKKWRETPVPHEAKVADITAKIAHSADRLQPPSIPSVYAEMKKAFPGLMMDQAHAVLYRMSKRGDIWLSPFTRSPATIPEPSAVMPIPGDHLYYVNAGKIHNIRNGWESLSTNNLDWSFVDNGIFASFFGKCKRDKLGHCMAGGGKGAVSPTTTAGALVAKMATATKGAPAAIPVHPNMPHVQKTVPNPSHGPSSATAGPGHIVPLSKGAKATVDHVDARGKAHEKAALDNVAKQTGLSHDEVKKRLLDAWDKAEVTMNLKHNKVLPNGKLLGDEIAANGRLKNLYESGHGGGLTDPGFRDKTEKKAFGETIGSVPTADRPKYGAVNWTGRENGAAPNFGSAVIVFDKKVLLDRMTMSPGDTGNRYVKPETLASGTNPLNSLARHSGALMAAGLHGAAGSANSEYHEVHFMGQLGINSKTVSAIRLPKDPKTAEGKRGNAAMERLAKNHGIKVEYVGWPPKQGS